MCQCLLTIGEMQQAEQDSKSLTTAMQTQVIRYERTREQARAIGLSTGEQGDKDAEEAAARLVSQRLLVSPHGLLSLLKARIGVI